MGRESDHIHIATLSTTSTSVPVRTGVPRVLWLYHVCCQEVEPMGRESDHIHTDHHVHQCPSENWCTTCVVVVPCVLWLSGGGADGL